MNIFLHVLIVEDSQNDTELIIHYLEKAGYSIQYIRVETAEEMKVALKKETWDIVLSDFNLPQFSGTEALELFKESGIDIPFVIVSNAIGEEKAVELMKAGAGDYVMKDKLGKLIPVVQRELSDSLLRKKQKQSEEALIRSEKMYNAMINNLPGFVYRCENDKKWTMRFISSSCKLITGYAPEDFIDNNKLSFNDIILPEYQEFLWNKWQNNLLNRTTFQDEYPIRTASGKIKWLWERGHGVFDNNDNLLYLEGYIDDVTESKQNKKLAQVLYQISEATHSSKNLDDLYSNIHIALSEIIKANNFFIALTNKNENKIYFPYFIDEKTPDDSDPIDLDCSKSLTSEVILTKKTLSLNYEDLQNRYSSGKNKIWGESPKCWLGVPLIIRNEIIGAMVVQDYENTESYTNEDVILFESTAGQIALTIDRKRADDSLHENEKKYRTLFNTITEAVALNEIIFDENEKMIDYRIIEVNQAYKAMTLLNEEQIIGNVATKIYSMPSKFINEFWEYHKNCSNTQYTEMFRPDLNRWFYVSTSPILNNTFITAFFDITSLKLSQEKLSENEKKLRAIYESSRDAIGVSKNGIHIQVNPSYLKMFGYSNEDEIVGNSILILIAKSNHDQVMQNVKNRILGIPAADFYITRGLRKDGSEFDMEVNVSTYSSNNEIYTVVLLRDITDKIRNERLLQENEERYRQLVEMSPDGIYIHQEGKFIFSNHAGAIILGGNKSDDLIGKTVIDFVHPDYKNLVKSRINQINIEHHNVPIIEEKLIRLDGVIIDVEVAGVPFQFLGKPAVQLMIRDITARKKAEADQLRLQNLESLGVLAGGIAHDFNNILSTVLGRTSIAMDNVPDGNVKNDLLSIEKATRRAVSLTNQLLTFSKGGTPEKCLIELRKIIQDTTKFSLSGSNVTVDFDFKDTLNIEADPGQISQVIQNLVINAKQAMLSGGHISIFTEDYEDPSENKFIKIIVKDQGTGISAEQIEKVFDPYFTSKQTGTGLGLTVCHSIIKRHEGKIWIESEIGKGSVFTILLPATTKNIIPKDNKIVTTTKELSILIMDDDESIRELLESLLSILGHKVSLTKEGNEAVKIYKERKERGAPFDLVFMDLTIKGGMGGKEAIKKLREYDPNAKVIVSSGYSDTSISSYRSDGFDGMLRKPYTKSDLIEIISEVLNQ